MDGIVGEEFEAYMIRRKQGGVDAAKSRSDSPLRKMYRLIPPPMRGIGPLLCIKKAYTKKDDAQAGQQGWHLFALSFVNFILNSDKGMVERHLSLFSDEESKESAKRIIREFTRAAFSGGFGPAQALYERELYSQVRREGGAYRFGEFLLPSNSFLPEVFLKHHGLKELPEDALARIKGMDFLDFGASCGDSALVLSKYTSGKIYSFEPEGSIFAKLGQTIKLNRLEGKVVAVQHGVGATTGKLCFDGFPRDAYFHNGQKPVFTSETVSADDFLKGKDADIGLIKMDIEGFELEALMGAEKTIKKSKPVVLAAVYHSGKDFFRIPEYLLSLNKGYQFKLRLMNEEYPTKEPVLIAY